MNRARHPPYWGHFSNLKQFLRVCFRPFSRSFSPLLCCSAVFSLQCANFHHRLKEIQFSGRLRKEQQKLVEVNKRERRPGGAKSSGLRLAASFISEASQLRPLSLIVDGCSQPAERVDARWSSNQPQQNSAALTNHDPVVMVTTSQGL